MLHSGVRGCARVKFGRVCVCGLHSGVFVCMCVWVSHIHMCVVFRNTYIVSTSNKKKSVLRIVYPSACVCGMFYCVHDSFVCMDYFPVSSKHQTGIRQLKNELYIYEKLILIFSRAK